MKKGDFLASGILLLVSLLVIGCGIPQEQYDTVVAERDSTQAELFSVQSELKTAKSELDRVKSELDSVRGQLSSAQTTVQSQEERLQEARTYGDVISSVFIPALKGETVNEVKWALEWISKVQALENPTVDALFEAVVDSNGGD